MSAITPKPLEHFLEICKIPHPSGDCNRLKEWLKVQAQRCGAEVFEDKRGNLLFQKGKPKVCLQGHYDMVYVGESKTYEVKPKIFEESSKQWIAAESSSLGADNGAALACMLAALREEENLECLITIDEEIGMLGAREVDLAVQSPYLINCDSEDIDEVVCGCAGGYDLEAVIQAKEKPIPKDYLIFTIQTRNFRGGHSGIEIHKAIPNAIVELAKILKSLQGILLTFSGGEKRNSIPVFAQAQIAIPKNSKTQALLDTLEAQYFVFYEEKEQQRRMGYESEILLDTILQIPNGVLYQKKEEVLLSSNLGILKQDKGQWSLCFMGRGNQENLMQTHIKKTEQDLHQRGFQTHLSDYYSPWEKEESELLDKVLAIYQAKNPKVKLKNIHAGLECGILKQKYPQKKFISIGPTILHPHSKSEKMLLGSFEEFWEILQKILKAFA